MGKLLVGYFGEPPQAESVEISLRDCHQRLSLKPSDFVSNDTPTFFRKAHGAKGKYLVFLVNEKEVSQTAMWKAGYYLLPLEAADVLKAFSPKALDRGSYDKRTFEVVSKLEPPLDVMERGYRWAVDSQPLLFKCHCPELLLKFDGPGLLNRHWKARLTCKKRCQPALKTQF